MEDAQKPHRPKAVKGGVGESSLKIGAGTQKSAATVSSLPFALTFAVLSPSLTVAIAL